MTEWEVHITAQGHVYEMTYLHYHTIPYHTIPFVFLYNVDT